MRSWKYIIVILCLCFFGKAQAQDAKWTSEQTNEARRDVQLINEVISLTEDQKALLTELFLDKNSAVERTSKLSTARRNWVVNIFLKRIEDILVYGYEIDRSKPEYEKEHRQELISKAKFEVAILSNEDLREALNLHIINEK